MMIRVRGSVFSNDCLWKHHLFVDRDPRFVELMSRDVKVEVFKPGEVIVKEGAKGNSMYILRRGEVEILAGGIPVTRLGSGSVFGEILLLGVADRRTATVRATEFSDCRVVQRKYMKRLLRLFPREKTYFEQLARQRLQELKVAAQSSPQRRQPAGSQSKTASGSVSTGPGVEKEVTFSFPTMVEDDGALQRKADSAALMATFSRFFERPSWHTGGTLKKSSQQFQSSMEPRRPVCDLLTLKDRPALPPLITRGHNAELPEQDSHGDILIDDMRQLSPPAKGGGTGTGDMSPRSVSPRSPSPRQRLFMYGKGPLSVSPRKKDTRNRLAESCSPRLPEQLD